MSENNNKPAVTGGQPYQLTIENLIQTTIFEFFEFNEKEKKND